MCVLTALFPWLWKCYATSLASSTPHSLQIFCERLNALNKVGIPENCCLLNM